MPPKTTTRPKKRKKRDTSPGNDRNHRTKARKIEAPQINPLETQAQIKSVARIPRGLRGPKGIKLKQIQYHKFNQDILIYHYAASFISVSNLRSLLNRQQHGYVNYLLGADPLASTPTPPGDETPPGCLEVGYLPSVFVLGGSALGFRLPSNPPATQWLCFDRDVRSLLQVLDIDTSTQSMLFEHVASLSRAPPPEKKWVRKLAYTEHKDWYVSLRDAKKVVFRLDLTWRSYWSDMFVENMKKKRDVQVEFQRRTAMVEGAVDMDEEEDNSAFGEEEKGSGEEAEEEAEGEAEEEEEGEDVEGENEEGDEEDEDEDEGEDTAIPRRRSVGSPDTIGRHSPFVYRDAIPDRNVTGTEVGRVMPAVA